VIDQVDATARELAGLPDEHATVPTRLVRQRRGRAAALGNWLRCAARTRPSL